MPRPSRDGRPARWTDHRRLTDRIIRSFTPELGRRVFYWDEFQRGLGLVIHPSGRKTFKLVYRHGGRPRWYNLGDASIGVAGARKLAAGILLQVAAGRDPAAERLADRRAGTFGELAARYVAEWSRKRNRSWKQADALVRKHLLPRWGHVRAREITRADVRAAVGRIERPILANQVLAAASAIFTWGVNQEVVPFNPCRGVEANPTTSRARVLSDGEIKTLWPRLDPALKLILFTGQRPGEVHAMRREDVRDGWWCLPGAPSAGWPGVKNKRDHRVPLSEPALALVDDHIAGRSRRRSRALLLRLCADHGLEPVRPHDLRRTFATIVAKLKFGRQAVSRLLNHSDDSVTSVYDRYSYSDEDKRIVDAIARHVERAAAGGEADNVVRLR
jgi:integrase